MRREFEETVTETLDVLRLITAKVSIIRYPEDPRERSIDLLARTKEGNNLFIKVAYDVNDVPAREFRELRRLSRVLDAKSVVVAKREGSEELEDDVAYERHGVSLLTPRGLYLAMKKSIYIVYRHGNYYMRVDGVKLREARERKGYSLGELAELIGISRRSVYEYERETMDVSITTALRLLEIFGDEVFKPIDVLNMEVREAGQASIKGDTYEEELIIRDALKRGAQVVHAKHAPLDLALKRGKERIVMVVEHGEKDNLIERGEEAAKIGAFTDSRLAAVVRSKARREIEGLGFEVYRDVREVVELLLAPTRS